MSCQLNKRLDANDIYKLIEELQRRGWMYPGVGSDHEPQNTNWCEAQSEGIGKFFQEGLKMIDWGCGYARYYNWLTGLFHNFKYYGFEPRGPRNGDILIEYCRKNLYDPRCVYDFIDNDTVVNQAIDECDVVLLGSVFTHISIEDADSVVKKFSKILDKGGYIVFSIILANEYFIGDKAYGLEDSYNVVRHKKEQIEQLARQNNAQLDTVTTYMTEPNRLHLNETHTIFRIRK